MLMDFLFATPTPLFRFESKDGKFIVDTCVAGDTGKPETGVAHPAYNGGGWIIVEEYKSEKLAKVGHDKWVKKMSAKKLPKSLKDVSSCEIAGMCEALGGDDWRECTKTGE